MQTNGDVLGDEGRKALDACVKVKIYGTPENIQKYHWMKAVDRLEECCNDIIPDFCYSLKSYEENKYKYLMLPMKFGENGYPDGNKRYDIIDIHDALCKVDKVPFVDKYPPAETNQTAGELRKLIDRRRAAIERECQEADKNPDGKEQYSWPVAQRRVRDCFAGNFVGDRRLLKYKPCHDRNNPDMFTIFDIHDAVGFWDEALVVGMKEATKNDDNYSVERFNSYKTQKEDIEQELSEARCAGDNDIVKEYARDDAKQRVKACFPEFFQVFPAADEYVNVLLPIKYDHNGVVGQTYNIFDINKAVQHLDQKKCLQKYPEDEGPGTDKLRKSVENHSSSVEEEYKKAKSGLCRYSPDEAEKRIRGCFENALNEEAVLFPANGKERIEVKRLCRPKFNSKVRIQAFNQTYDILDIHKVFCLLQEKLGNQYPHESVQANRDGVIKEYQQAVSSVRQYLWDEAECRVRGCFAGALLEDTDIFPDKEKESGIPKTKQTYDIFEIKRAVDHFDVKPRFDKHKIVNENDFYFKNWNNKANEARAQIKEEYFEATKSVEIDHGSGFVIHNHFIITNKHVIEDVLLQDKQREVYVSNSVIGELHCEVIDHDVSKDLALLYCPELNLSDNQISPLQLSTQSLLPGMQIFAFGFPMSHTGERALFVTGHVSGSKTTYSGPTLAVLNCSLNAGNSGGPILCWDKGQLKVVGVATQKHFKEILTLKERQKIETIRESLQTSTICGVSDDDIKDATFQRESGCFRDCHDPCQIPMSLLTLKLYDALETHSQFNLSNALPGCSVVEFIKECIGKHSGEGKEKLKEELKKELAEVVEWSEDHINILPSAERSAVQCCVQ